MSRMKEYFGGGRSGGMSFYNVSRARRCPVCDGDSWCSVRSDGLRVACRRDSTGDERTDSENKLYWLHRLGPAGARLARAACPLRESGTPRASAAALDEAHRIVLRELPLMTMHREALRARGLPDAEIVRRGYRTLPRDGRARIARELVEQLGEGHARGVPGMYVAEEGDRSWWTFGGSPGLLVPVRDVAGRIVALKVRRDGGGDGPRYMYVSSKRHGGPGACSAVHVPQFEGPRAVVRVTEGELKADVCTVLSDVLTISVPGVGSWAAALPVLRELGARGVRVAFDADHKTKPEVGRALSALVRALRAEKHEVTVEVWDEALGKGLDDVLARRVST